MMVRRGIGATCWAHAYTLTSANCCLPQPVAVPAQRGLLLQLGKSLHPQRSTTFTHLCSNMSTFKKVVPCYMSCSVYQIPSDLAGWQCFA